MVRLEVAICDLKLGRTKNGAFRFYRTWNFNAIQYLNSEIAIKMSVQIIETFVQLRKWVANYDEIMIKIKGMEAQYNTQFTEVYEALQYLLSKPKDDERTQIGYKKNRNN